MTREEAIKELTELLPEEFLSEYTDAIKMAIKALEQEPCEDRLKNLEEAILLINDTIASLTRTTILNMVDIEEIKKEVKKC